MTDESFLRGHYESAGRRAWQHAACAMSIAALSAPGTARGDAPSSTESPMKATSGKRN